VKSAAARSIIRLHFSRLITHGVKRRACAGASGMVMLLQRLSIFPAVNTVARSSRSAKRRVRAVRSLKEAILKAVAVPTSAVTWRLAKNL
jgi:hypothetical protein